MPVPAQAAEPDLTCIRRSLSRPSTDSRVLFRCLIAAMLLQQLGVKRMLHGLLNYARPHPAQARNQPCCATGNDLRPPRFHGMHDLRCHGSRAGPPLCCTADCCAACGSPQQIPRLKTPQFASEAPAEKPRRDNIGSPRLNGARRPASQQNKMQNRSPRSNATMLITTTPRAARATKHNRRVT